MKDFNKLYEFYKNIESGHQKKFNKDTLKKFLEKKTQYFYYNQTHYSRILDS